MAEPNPRRERFVAEQRRDAKQGFYIHFIVYIAVMVLLITINALTSGPWWVQWPLIGWGLGILGHAYLALWRK